MRWASMMAVGGRVDGLSGVIRPAYGNQRAQRRGGYARTI